MHYKLFGSVAALALAACGPGAVAANDTAANKSVTNASVTGNAAAPAKVQDAHDTPALQLAAGGLGLRDMESGDVDTVGFDTDQDTVVEAIGKALGDPTDSGTLDDCGEGALSYVRFQGDVSLYFKAGQFAGWNAGDESGFYTATEIHVGSTHKEVMAASKDFEGEESSLGYEFTADGISGLLSSGDPDGKVTALWSGMTCIAR
jgi:hypothetical protein